MENTRDKFTTACGKFETQISAELPVSIIRMGEDRNFAVSGGCEGCVFKKVRVINDQKAEKLMDAGKPFSQGDHYVDEVLSAYRAVVQPVISAADCSSINPNEDETTVINAVSDLFKEPSENGPTAIPQSIYDALDAARVINAEVAEKARVKREEHWVKPIPFTSERVLSARSEIGDAVIALATEPSQTKGRLFSLLDIDLATELGELQAEINLSPATAEDSFRSRLF